MTVDDWTARLKLELELADLAKRLDLEELRALLAELREPRIRRAAGPAW